MAHSADEIENLSPDATTAEIIAALNEIIDQLNHMWHDPEPEAE